MGERVGAEVVDLGCARAATGVRVHAEPAGAQPLEELPLGVDVQGRLVGDGVDEGLQVSMGRDLGVLLAQAAGGGVARVREGLAAGVVGVLVQAHEAVLGHVDLAADLDGLPEAGVGDLGEALRRERVGDVLDGEDVGGHVLARGAVAAGRRADELGVFVGERDAEAVDLELAGVGDGPFGRRAEGLVGAREPLVELGEVHRVVDGVHALGMANRLELLRDVAADALRVRVGAHELGVRCLEGEELLEQTVELGVRDLRPIERVIAVGIGVEQPVELRRACAGALFPPLPASGGGARRRSPEQRPLLGRHVVLVRHVVSRSYAMACAHYIVLQPRTDISREASGGKPSGPKPSGIKSPGIKSPGIKSPAQAQPINAAAPPQVSTAAGRRVSESLVRQGRATPSRRCSRPRGRQRGAPRRSPRRRSGPPRCRRRGPRPRTRRRRRPRAPP